MASLKAELLSSRAEMHAAQDGVLVALLLTIPLIEPRIATVLFAILGGSGMAASKSIKVQRIIKVADNLIRMEQIENNPGYFTIPFVGVSSVILGVAYYFNLIDPSVLVL